MLVPEAQKPKHQTSRCRICEHRLTFSFIDLGSAPLSNRFLRNDVLSQPETIYPLQIFVCDQCFLVQLDAGVSPSEIFDEYPYFSSFSSSWLAHVKTYTTKIIKDLELSQNSLVVELGSNDGALLRCFKERGISILGIDPAKNIAAIANKNGIPTRAAFFSQNLSQSLVNEIGRADLIVGNNVLAQIPNILDFVSGIRHLLKPDGVVTIEFPQLLELIRNVQFDTIYHEHFSYFSLLTAQQLFARCGLTVFDAEKLEVHGGSLRIYGCRSENQRQATHRLKAIEKEERENGLDTLSRYLTFHAQVLPLKQQLLEFLWKCRTSGKSIVGYGAPAKGNTLLNYCGIGPDLLPYTVDRNPYKVGMVLPGSRIPIFPISRLQETNPDFVLILPWNLREEIQAELQQMRGWNGRWVIANPHLEVGPVH